MQEVFPAVRVETQEVIDNAGLFNESAWPS